MNPVENQADQRQAPKQEPSDSLVQNPYAGQSAANLITSDPIPNPYISSPGKPQANLQYPPPYPPPYPVDSELVPNPYRKSGRILNNPQPLMGAQPGVCPLCHSHAPMINNTKIGCTVLAWSISLFCLTGICCFWIPFLMDDCYDKEYICTACNRAIYTQ